MNYDLAKKKIQDLVDEVNRRIQNHYDRVEDLLAQYRYDTFSKAMILINTIYKDYPTEKKDFLKVIDKIADYASVLTMLNFAGT